MLIVKNPSELRELKKLGIVEFTSDTLTKLKSHIGGATFTCNYVYSVIRTELNGYIYRELYQSGCFYPYVSKTKI